MERLVPVGTVAPGTPGTPSSSCPGLPGNPRFFPYGVITTHGASALSVNSADGHPCLTRAPRLPSLRATLSGRSPVGQERQREQAFCSPVGRSGLLRPEVKTYSSFPSAALGTFQSPAGGSRWRLLCVVRPHRCHPHHCHTALPRRRLWRERWKVETSGLPFTLSSTRPLGPPMPSVPVGLRKGQGDTKVSRVTQTAQHPRGNRSIPWDGWGEVRPDPVLLNFGGVVLFGVQKALF